MACLRGLSPFLPTLRGAPVTIEPHMQNASTFPPASALRLRKVVQFRYARPESGILTTVLFDLSSITPARPLSREKRCTRPRPPSIEGETVQVGKSVCTCQGARRTPSGLHAIRGAPRVLYGGRRPCQAVAPARMGDCRARRMGRAAGVLSLLTVPIIARGAVPVNTFFQKNFSAVFFKDNENARARRGSQNRRKQAKTEVLSAEKFFEKIRKSAQKRFFRRAARLFF